MLKTKSLCSIVSLTIATFVASHSLAQEDDSADPFGKAGAAQQEESADSGSQISSRRIYPGDQRVEDALRQEAQMDYFETRFEDVLASEYLGNWWSVSRKSKPRCSPGNCRDPEFSESGLAEFWGSNESRRQRNPW